MLRKYELPLVISAMLLMLVPHIKYVVGTGLCGWDCPWYVWHLSQGSMGTYHKFTEPLYFWLFKPFILMGADTVIVMKVSLIVMMLFAMIGVYLLSKRLRLNIIERLLVVGIFAVSPLTLGLWDDTLRNFLSFSFLPWLFYFILGNSRKDAVLSYLSILMMILSHRMVLAVFPMILIFRVLKKQWKRLWVDLGAGIVALGIMSIMTDKMSGLKFYGFVLVKFLEGNWWGFMPKRFDPEVLALFALIAVGVGIAAFIRLSRVKGDVNDKPIELILWYVFIASVFFSKILAHRLILMFGMMIALMCGIGIRRYREAKMKKLHIAAWIVAGIIFSYSFITAMMIPTEFHRAERDFIDNIELPPGKGTILLVPDRLYWYAMYKHQDITVWRVNFKSYSGIVLGRHYEVINHPTPDEAWVYAGVNRVADMWLIDTCSHFTPKEECPLVLKYSEKNSNGKLETAPYARQP